MFEKPFVFVDVETTGSVENGRMTEIACIRVEDGTVADKFVQLINPQQFIPYHIQNLTGIVNEMVEDKPVFSGIADRVDHITQNAVFVAHNVWFDYQFVRSAMHRSDREFHRDLLCTVRLAQQVFPGINSHSLDAMIEYCNISVGRRHRAYADAKALHDLMKLLKRGKEQQKLKAVVTDLIVKNA